MKRLTPLQQKLLAFVVSLITLVTGVTIAITDDDGDGQPDRITITVPAQPPAAPAGDLQPDIENGKPANLADDTPDDVPDAQLEAGEEQIDEIQEELPDRLQPVGGAQNLRCVKHFGGTPHGPIIRPVSGKVHYTAGPNSTGWGDVTGTHTFMNRSGNSATFILDFEGHCVQTMPLRAKPYTQLAHNGSSWSVEVIARGTETRAQWLAAPIFKRGLLAELIRTSNTALGLPVRFVDPQGCGDIPGWTTHYHLECGNNHYDVMPSCFRSVREPWVLFSSPFGPPGCTGFPGDVLQAQLVNSLPKTGLQLLYKGERKKAGCLRHERKVWPHAKTKAKRRASINRAKACKRWIAGRVKYIRRNVRKADRRPGVTRKEAYRQHRRGARIRVLDRIHDRKPLGRR